MSARRILVVDDDDALRGMVRTTLGRDYEVVEARDGDEALALIAADPPDLVVLDWIMPGRGGEDVLKRVKKRRPGLPIVVLTAEKEQRTVSTAVSLGSDVFLTKPFSPLQLLDAIERLLA